MRELSRPALRRLAREKARRAPSYAGIAPAVRGGAISYLPPFALVRRFELRMQALCTAARVLPALTAENAAEERARLQLALERGDAACPRWQVLERRVPGAAFRLLDVLRNEASSLPAAALYLARLEELELDLMLIDALGKPRQVRPLAARRYGTGATLVPTARGPRPLIDCAREILARVPPGAEPRELPAEGENGVGQLITRLAGALGLEVSIRIEPSLSAGAATGERTVFLAARNFGRREAQRLAVHEVLGHLVSAANARAQPLRLLEWGTAGAFADQEGLALYIEDQCHLLDGPRLRTLAGRVLAADMMHAGASFAEASKRLHGREQFSVPETIALCERAYRGGGVARDVGYLAGWMRVQQALGAGLAELDELRLGRVGLDALPLLRELLREGYVRKPVFRPVLPNFACNFFSTSSGTTPLRSPPSDAASLIKLELTKE